MANKFLYGGDELNFVTVEGEVPLPRMEEDVLRRANVAGYGYRRMGRRAAEGRIVTTADITAALADAAYATYYAWVGMTPYLVRTGRVNVLVKVRDIQSFELLPAAGVVGGFYGSSAAYVIQCAWVLQCPGG